MLGEQLICNQQVASSILAGGSKGEDHVCRRCALDLGHCSGGVADLVYLWRDQSREVLEKDGQKVARIRLRYIPGYASGKRHAC